MSNTLLKTGTLVRTSERGHYNFEYPSNSQMLLKEHTAVNILPWVKFAGWKAVLIQNGDAIPGSYRRKVVWVRDEDLLQR